MTLSQRILSLCSRSTYENVGNFEWYISVLVDLAHVANVNIGSEIRDQLVDVVGRVRGIRRYAVKLMYTLLSDESMIRNASEEGSCSEVLWAAAWIGGEYCLQVYPFSQADISIISLMFTGNCQSLRNFYTTSYNRR